MFFIFFSVALKKQHNFEENECYISIYHQKLEYRIFENWKKNDY